MHFSVRKKSVEVLRELVLFLLQSNVTLQNLKKKIWITFFFSTIPTWIPPFTLYCLSVHTKTKRYNLSERAPDDGTSKDAMY